MTDRGTADLADTLESIIAGLVTSDRVPVRQRTRLNSASWDSLFQLTLVLAIEQEFGVTLSDTDVLDLNSFDSALHILEEKLASR
ncbi:MAG TPA: phosphopantetheine-binding protein [Vicinamibacterales bacterium]|jgi:acyl carrier protein|nr:phosphopantetheine-binding protein [Vicinamibacterales bacterium]